MKGCKTLKLSFIISLVKVKNYLSIYKRSASKRRGDYKNGFTVDWGRTWEVTILE